MWFALIVAVVLAAGTASPGEAVPGVLLDGDALEIAITPEHRGDEAPRVLANGSARAPGLAQDGEDRSDRARPVPTTSDDRGGANPASPPSTVHRPPSTVHRPPSTADRPPTARPPLPWPRAARVPELAEQASATLLTMLPGEDVYALWGHTALRIRDPALGIDRTYNYGTFDFDQPNFLLRFLRGRTDYRLAVSTFDQTLAQYRFLERPVIEQHLGLEQEDLQALFVYLETNLLPENRVYRYDFIFDNCSTRPRDALEWVLGDRFSIAGYEPPDSTIRELIRPYTAAAPLTAFGIELGFGRPVDRAPTPREAAFLPIELFDALETASLDGRPLVTSTDTLFWIEGAGMPSPRPDVPMILATLLLLGAVTLTMRSTASPRALAALDGAVLAFAGLTGLLLALMWLATEHHVTRVNADLLWAWPTHLAAAVILARSRTDRIALRAVRTYLALAAAGAGTAGLLGVVGILSMHPAASALAVVIAVRCADRVRAMPEEVVRR